MDPTSKDQCNSTNTSHIRNGYILLSIDSLLTPLLLNHMVNIAHNIFGPSIHLSLQGEDRLIITLPLQAKDGFVDKCHRFRKTLLSWKTKDFFLSKILLVITLNRANESSEEVVQRLLKGKVVSSTMLESHGLCML